MSAVLRLVLFFILLSAGIVSAFYLLYVILGHRRFVPLFRVLKFKLDDMKRTEKKVEEIMGDDNAKPRKKSTRKSTGKAKRKRGRPKKK